MQPQALPSQARQPGLGLPQHRKPRPRGKRERRTRAETERECQQTDRGDHVRERHRRECRSREVPGVGMRGVLGCERGNALDARPVIESHVRAS